MKPESFLTNPETPVATQTQAKNSKLLILLILLVIVLTTFVGVTIGYLLGSSKNQVAVSVPITSPSTVISSPSPTSTPDPTANWKTYTNEDYKFQLKYPNTWQLNGKMFTSPQGNSLSLMINSPGYGIECYQNEKEETINLNNQIVTKTFMIGIKSDLCDNGNQSMIFVATKKGNNKIDLLYGYKVLNKKESESLFDQILSTFKFLE